MTDDIVTQLRAIAPIHEGRKGHGCIAKAADEIERLRAGDDKDSLLWRLNFAYNNPFREHLLPEAATEIQRLRAEVRELRALREACKEHHCE